MRLHRMAALVAVVVIGALALGAGSAPGRALFTNCTVYVGYGDSTCNIIGYGNVTSGGASTTGYAKRDDNHGVTSPNCIGSDGRIVVWYTNQSGSSFGFNYSPYGGCSSYQSAGSGGVLAQSSCAISAPPPSRSLNGYCFTRWTQ